MILLFKVVSSHKHTFPANDRSLLQEGLYSGLPSRIQSLKRTSDSYIDSPISKKKNSTLSNATSPAQTPPWVKQSLYSPSVPQTQSISARYTDGHIEMDGTLYTKGSQVHGTLGHAFDLESSRELNDKKRVLRFDHWVEKPFQHTEGRYISGPGIIPTIRGQIPSKEYGYVSYDTQFIDSFSVREDVHYLGEQLNEAHNILRENPSDISPEQSGSLNFARYLFFVSISLDLIRPIRTVHKEGANLGGHGSYDYGVYQDRIYMDLPGRLTEKKPTNTTQDKGLYTAPEVGIMAHEPTENDYYPNVTYNTPLDLTTIIGPHTPLPPETHSNTLGQCNDMWDFGMTLMHMVLGDQLFAKADPVIQHYLQDKVPFEKRINSSDYKSDLKNIFCLTETPPPEPEQYSWESLTDYLDRSIRYYESLENRAKNPSTKYSIYVRILKTVNSYIDKTMPFLIPLKPLLFSCLSPHYKQRPSADTAREVLNELSSKMPFFGPIEEKEVPAHRNAMFQKFISSVKTNPSPPTYIGHILQQSTRRKELDLEKQIITHRLAEEIHRNHTQSHTSYSYKSNPEPNSDSDDEVWGTVIYEEDQPIHSSTDN